VESWYRLPWNHAFALFELVTYPMERW